MSDKLKLYDVVQAIMDEMDYQDKKWGANKPQSLPGFILVAKNEIAEAEAAWTKSASPTGRHSTLSELLQATTVLVRALQRYGVEGCAQSTNDKPIAPLEQITTKTGPFMKPSNAVWSCRSPNYKTPKGMTPPRRGHRPRSPL